MTKRIFVTGTDTEVGKTYISEGILKLLNGNGLSAIGLKPIASGCEEEGGRLINEDALRLQAASAVKMDYDLVNPVRFREPAAPNILGQIYSFPVSVANVLYGLQPGLAVSADIVLIEGFGGWAAPINSAQTCGDLAKELEADVVLVVGMRLGCLNHALLTAQNIQTSGLALTGWVANFVDPEFKYATENLAWLKKAMNNFQVPCIGEIERGAEASSSLSLEDWIRSI